LSISPLRAIQNDQSTTLNSVSSSYRGFVLDGDTNTPTNRYAMARAESLMPGEANDGHQIG